MKTASEFHALTEMIRLNEGVRAKIYKDSLGIPTIGVGFNLQRADASGRLHTVGSDLTAVLAGFVLSEDQITRLLRLDVDDVVEDVRTLVHLDAMPIEAQLVLCDLRFNIGPTSFRKFTTTLEAFRRGHYKKAALQLEASKWAGQVGKRAVRSVQMLRRLTNGEHLP